MVNLLSLIPDETLVKICEYADPKTKRALSMVDRRTNRVAVDTVRCIQVFPPFPCRGYRLNIPEGILVKVIGRYPNLEKIKFGSKKNCFKQFGVKDMPYFKELISFLNGNHHEHTLASVKKIKYYEINPNENNEELKKLNRCFLSSIGHKGLENIGITASIDSTLTGTEIQSVLINSPNLKTFVFSGVALQRDKIVTLTFANQPQLSKVKLLNWSGYSSTIDSLRNCKDLEELVIHNLAIFDRLSLVHLELKAILLGEHPWNLKHLELKGIIPYSDVELDIITKKLPNLECFCVKVENIYDEGMELLGRNCPKLKILQLSNPNISNSGLDRLTQHLPLLEIIDLDLAFDINEDGIAAIARNCKNLRFLRVIHLEKLEKSGINALMENCHNLIAVKFSCTRSISFEGMHDLVEQMPKLRYVELDVCSSQEKEKIEFYEKFPHLSNIPSCSSAKKLHKLTI